MKPITEEQQKALIEYCEKEICHTQKMLESASLAIGWRMLHEENLLKNQIVLASLTAEPAAYVMGDDAIDDFNRGYEFFAVRGIEHEEELESLTLYTAPPVPVIQLPEKHSDREGSLTDIEQGYNDAIDEIKRLNGLS